MKTSTIFLSILLVASISFNIYQFLSRRDSTPTEEKSSEQESVAQYPNAPNVRVKDPVSTKIEEKYCSAQIQRILKLEKELYRNLVPMEKYERSTSDPTLTKEFDELIRPFLKSYIERGLSIDVECHGRVCKLTMVDKDGNLSMEADSALNDVKKLREFTSSVMKSATVPTKDIRTNEALSEYNSYYETYEEGAESGRNKLRELWSRAKNSPEMQDCLRNAKGKGEIEISIGGRPGKKVSYNIGGDTDDQQFDSCVRKVLDNYISGTSFGDNEYEAVVYTSLVIPAP